MKTLILAGGLGARLRPLTNKTPKPLLKIGDKALLMYHLESLTKFGCTEVLINSHYLPDQLKEFVNSYCGPIKITLSYEKDLLGSAGTLAANRKFFANEKDFLVIYGDNLTNIDYNHLYSYHEMKGGIATLACYYESDPAEKGVVFYGDDSRILSFVEKPGIGMAPSYVNGGIYIFSSKIFDYLVKNFDGVYDISKHLFSQKLLDNERVYIYQMTEFLLDIGSLDSYRKANEIVKELF